MKGSAEFRRRFLICSETNFLGAGAYAAVLKAIELRRSSLNLSSGPGHRMAAIKICSTENERTKKTFQNELDLLRGKEHPNVVSVLTDQLFEASTMLYGKVLALTLEFLAGGTLSELRKKSPTLRLDMAEAMTISRQLMAGLTFLHSHEIAHMDIKPSNLVFATKPPSSLAVRSSGGPNVAAESSSVLKIIDFGLARRIPGGFTTGGEPGCEPQGSWPPRSWSGSASR